MKALKVDSLKKPVLLTRFFTDYYSNFFFTAPKVEIGFFRHNTPIESIAPGQFCPAKEISKWGHSSWKVPCPLIIKDEKVVQLKIHLYSEGNAP